MRRICEGSSCQPKSLPSPAPSAIALAEGLVALGRLSDLTIRLEAVLSRLEAAAALAPPPLDETDSLAMSVNELCRRGGFSRSLAYEHIKQGTLPSVTIGRRRLIPSAAAREVLARGLPEAPHHADVRRRR